MNLTISEPAVPDSKQFPMELVALKERIADQPAAVREELEPLIDEVLEHAVFRSRVMLIARDALQRFRVEMAAMQFDLEATRPTSDFRSSPWLLQRRSIEGRRIGLSAGCGAVSVG